MKNVKDDLQEVLLSEEQLQAIVCRIAAEVDATYSQGDAPLLLVATLKGAVVFTADLMRQLNTSVDIEFIKASSYGSGTVSSGNLRIDLDIKREDLSNYHVLIVEDIIDSGRTLTRLKKHLEDRGAKSVRTCTLLDKPSRRTVPFEADFVGREIPDAFVIGYGLDYDEKYRDLPFVGVLKPEIYQ